MKRLHWALLVLLLVSGTAAATTAGPLLDYDQPVPTGITWSLDTTCEYWPGYYYHDKIVISTSTAPVHVRGLAYILRADLGGLEDGNAMVTTIYGQAYTPVGSGLETTGFNALSPEMTPTSGETIFGNSGTAYESSWASGPTALSDLPSLPQLQGFDLSPFQGDQSSVVYVLQTFVPTADFAPVPEPLTMTAIGMGVAGLGGYICRRRMAAK